MIQIFLGFMAIVTKDTFECGSAHIHVLLSSDCCCFTSLAIPVLSVSFIYTIHTVVVLKFEN